MKSFDEPTELVFEFIKTFVQTTQIWLKKNNPKLQ